MIERATIEDMFSQMRNQENAPFDIDSNCLWTYFLYDSDPELLEAVAAVLVDAGFFCDGLLEPVSEDGSEPDEEPVQYFLPVSRVETHTVDSLMELNEWFNQLAEYYGLEGYDGMEVGAADPSPVETNSLVEIKKTPKK
jgi:hypothetical protein